MPQSAHARLVFLTGPTGAGKTSTGMLWAATRDRPTWFYDWDAVRGAIVLSDSLRGFAEMDIDTQYQLAANVMAASAERTVQDGIDCVAAGAWAHPSAVSARYAGTWDRLRELDPLVVVLLPRLEVCVARHAADRTRRGGESESRQAVEFWYPMFGAWTEERNVVVVDTSDLSREETAAELERLTAGPG